jgi:hypothetical protein
MTAVAHEKEDARSAVKAEANTEFEERLRNISASARRLPPGSDDETQDELGLILQLLPAVERSRDFALLGNLELAVVSLLAQPPNRLLAIRLREASQQSVLRRSFIRSILPGSSASTWVIAGMATLLYFGIPIALAITYLLLPEGGVYIGEQLSDEGRLFPYTGFMLVALAGALGSIVSILVRVKDFSEIRILNPPALFWTGFFKPVIGATFALFVLCAFAAGLIDVTEGVNEDFMLLTLGFIAGFSERFAPDLVGRLETTITGSPSGVAARHPPEASD